MKWWWLLFTESLFVEALQRVWGYKDRWMGRRKKGRERGRGDGSRQQIFIELLKTPRHDGVNTQVKCEVYTGGPVRVAAVSSGSVGVGSGSASKEESERVT